MKNTFTAAGSATNDIALRILNELLPWRRRLDTTLSLAEEEAIVTQTQLPRIRHFVEKNLPIQCVLPAFPTKSPNPNKVLGKRPDMGERLSLIFLNSLCQRIQFFYPPGAHITICSDGHVFGDIIRVSDDDINIYQRDIENILHEVGATHLSVYNLGDVEEMASVMSDYDKLRQRLIEKYAEPQEDIKQRLIASEEGLQLYRAIIRFMYEDSLVPGYSGSNAALQKDAKQRACTVIQRSWAWGNLLGQIFPDAIRLSIHPQPADNLKLGIHMLPTRDNWLTPWHAVAVKTQGQFVLMSRKSAEELPGGIVDMHGRPDYYATDDNVMLKTA